ncbi:type I polyketide synthase [Amycolatopsis sp. cg5]|uniref:type I polyketide synthase n=1 Tax=Amycolatopsis sp. cg5 TaxID=3238802 RepID=UPI00352489B6
MDDGIAIIGLACRFPDARDHREFWANLMAGKESVRPVSQADYLAAGGDPAGLTDPDLVRVESAIPEMDRFDAEFFGYSPGEAELLDPQHRVFLELGWHALEDAGYQPSRYDGAIGVYAGANDSRYFLENLYPRLAAEPHSVRTMAAHTANSASALPTRLSYHLNLRGPSVSVQTACSTSLVAVHLACRDLLDFTADLALAGGVAINPSLRRGYRYVQDGPYSPDGRVRAFSAGAQGMSAGNGAGLVVLKRLDEALADGDHIRAVIRGSAINNDGKRKVGFTAPSPQGQVEVIVTAQELAGISPNRISYVEAHGTGTLMGDPIEVSALTEAFGRGPARTGPCGLGSVKTNIGHLDSAAGIAGLIKTVLALENRVLPASLNLGEPNPAIDFAGTFEVLTEPTPWTDAAGPLTAGVSSFGIGGTNAHVIVEEAPGRSIVDPATGWHVLRWTAASADSAREFGQRLGEHLRDHPDVAIADVAHTLENRLAPLPFRASAAGRDAAELADALLSHGCDVARSTVDDRAVAFLFPGGGAQYDRMGRDLYREDPLYREIIDDAAAIVEPVLGYDLREVLFSDADEPADGTVRLDGEGVRRSGTFPAVVATEYALGRVLLARGLKPSGLLGHSLGEYAAACLAGVFTLEDVLVFVCERERLLSGVGGTTLSVRFDAEALAAKYLTERMSLTAVNAPGMCVVSGPTEDIIGLEDRLYADGVERHRLRIPGAAHSALLDPVLGELGDALRDVKLSAPTIPLVSNVTGDWLTDAEATDPAYWVRHTRETVRFADGLARLTAGDPVLLEVGPDGGLAKLARGQLDADTVNAMRHRFAEHDDTEFLHGAFGKLWSHGVPVEFTEPGGRRISLPGYCFERRRFWIDPPNAPVHAAAEEPSVVDEPGDTVALVTAIWRAELGVDTIGADDNFFDLGGHSLLLLQVVTLLRERTGVQLSVRQLFLNRRLTVAGFAAAIESGGQA